MHLETERLLLRSLERDDIERIVALWADPEATRFLGGPRDPDVVRHVLEAEVEEPPADRLGQWPLVEKSSGEVVGDCGLIEKEVDGVPCVDLVYVLARPAWGKGYATEIAAALVDLAFDELGLERLVAIIHPDNDASKRVAAKLGMVLESRSVRPDGVTREVWCMATP